MKKDSNHNDPFDFLDDQLEVHTPESIQERCRKLVDDAKGVVPGIRVVGIMSMTDQVACQFAENDLCNQMLSYLSGLCGRGATEQFEQDCGDELCPKCAAKEMPTMDELDSEKDEILE
jgi:hypothetical protein